MIISSAFGWFAGIRGINSFFWRLFAGLLAVIVLSSFLGFAPAEDPSVMALITIDEPQGIYYGGTIAAPAVAEVFDMILPYLGIKAAESPEE